MTTTSGDESLTALGEVLEAARGAMSKREAAKRAGISEGRWRQIVTGRQPVGGGTVVPANPKRETVIAMARAVGVPVAEALTAAGMEPGPVVEMPPRRSDTGDVPAAIEADTALSEEARVHLLSQYEMLRRLSELDGRTQQSTRRVALPGAPRTDEE